MSLTLRNILFTIIVPGAGAVYAPWWILTRGGNPKLAAWYALVFVALGAALYVWCLSVWFEEPTLRAQFGDQCDDHRRSVSHWIPRTAQRQARLKRRGFSGQPRKVTMGLRHGSCGTLSQSPATASVGAPQGWRSAFLGYQSVATHTTVEGEKDEQLRTARGPADPRERFARQFFRVANPLARRLMSVGVPTGSRNILLTVRGRRSGMPRTTPP